MLIPIHQLAQTSSKRDFVTNAHYSRRKYTQLQCVVTSYDGCDQFKLVPKNENLFRLVKSDTNNVHLYLKLNRTYLSAKRKPEYFESTNQLYEEHNFTPQAKDNLSAINKIAHFLPIRQYRRFFPRAQFVHKICSNSLSEKYLYVGKPRWVKLCSYLIKRFNHSASLASYLLLFLNISFVDQVL